MTIVNNLTPIDIYQATWSCKKLDEIPHNLSFFFFLNEPPTPEISPLPLHAAFPIFKPHRRNVTALLGAEQVARAADFQVAHGDFEAAAQRGVLFDGADPFAGVGQQTRVARQQQVRVSLVLVTSHPPAELIKVAQAEPVCPINDNRVG